MKKQYKIMVCISQSDSERAEMIRKLCVRIGLAKTPGDAAKLIKETPYEYDLSLAYLVVVKKFNLKESPRLFISLYNMAVAGLPIIIGTAKLHHSLEMFCEVYQESDL